MAERKKAEYAQQEADAVRPVCTLDRKAEALGVYDEDFHKKPRYERSALVHKAVAERADQEEWGKWG